jgi:restriction system protein
MAVPPFHALMLPLLQIASDGKEHSLDDCESELAKQFNLSPEDLSQLLPSGRQTVFENRLGWARTFLKKAGLLEAPVRGKIRITDRGRTVLTQAPSYIDTKFLDQFPEFVDFRKLQRKPKEIVARTDLHNGAENTPDRSIRGCLPGPSRLACSRFTEQSQRMFSAFFREARRRSLARDGVRRLQGRGRTSGGTKRRRWH